MTGHCLDTDSLVSVAAALEWDLPARLDHLAACEGCRARLAQLAELHCALAAAAPVADLDPAAVSARAAAGSATMPPAAGPPALTPVPPRAVPHAATPLVTAATFLTAGATALLVVSLLAGNPPAPLALTIAALAGLASITPVRRLRPA